MVFFVSSFLCIALQCQLFQVNDLEVKSLNCLMNFGEFFLLLESHVKELNCKFFTYSRSDKTGEIELRVSEVLPTSVLFSLLSLLLLIMHCYT